MPAKPLKNVLTKLKSVEVWIQPRYVGASGRRAQVLMARMVCWYNTEDGLEPKWGKCLLSPNQVIDFETAKRLVKRYVSPIAHEVVFNCVGFDGKALPAEKVKLETPASAW